jgi:hypothetical protein
MEKTGSDNLFWVMAYELEPELDGIPQHEWGIEYDYLFNPALLDIWDTRPASRDGNWPYSRAETTFLVSVSFAPNVP